VGIPRTEEVSSDMSEQVSQAELIWWNGELGWRDGHIKDMQPRLEYAYATAIEGLAETCFEVTGNKKMYVRRVPVGSHSLGTAHSYDTFSFFLNRENVAQSRHEFGHINNVRAIAHELTHMERMRNVPFDFSPRERLVTEGLAMLGEAHVGELLGSSDVSQLADSVIRETNYWRWKYCEYITDAQDEAEFDEVAGEKDKNRLVLDKWFKRNVEGYCLGVWVVMFSYLEHNDFGRLLRTPTNEFLDTL
jgi:hypothetical protein